MVGLYNFLVKKGLMVALGIGILFIILHFVGISGGIEEFSQIPEDPASKPERLEVGSKMVSMGIMVTVALLAITFVVALVFAIIQVLSNPKGALAGIAGLVVILIIFGIGYSMSAGEVEQSWIDKDFGITPTISKYVSGAVFASAVMVGLAVLGLVVSEIRNFFK